MNNSLAIFVHYAKNGKPCNNAILYILELAKYFNEVIVASNISHSIENDNVTWIKFDKNGYDFGYFYQALELVNAYDNYDTIGLFNDSNYIIRPLKPFMDWVKKTDCLLCGITDCNYGRPDVQLANQYHIQSHAVIYKKQAILMLSEHFTSIKMDQVFDIKDSYELRSKIIIDCEIMTSINLISKGIKAGAYYSVNDILPALKPDAPANTNPHIILWKELIESTKYPFIKKKILDLSFHPYDMQDLNKNTLIYPMSEANAIVERFGNPEFVPIIYK